MRAYDTAQEMVRRQEAEERRRAMNDRQATTAEAMASALTRRIGDLLALDQSAINAARDIQNLLALGKPVPPELQDRVTLRPALTIASRELAALWSAALQAERLARGAATEIASAQGDEDATAARADTQAGVVDADNVVFYYPTPALAPRDDDAADDAVDDDAVDTAERDA
ncbi:MAG: hypothetical protein KGK07_17155 [Chloroflexota bacterium]|nr:hypothetical protein [Chloroflexota bacterium]